MEIERLATPKGKKLEIWKRFLADAGLEADLQVDQTVLVWDGDRLVATGSRQGALLKCIAVDSARQGEGLTATVLTELRRSAFDSGHRHLFLYTKPKNRALFASLLFYPVAQTDSVLLMEDRRGGIHSFLDTLPVQACSGSVGALIMNCNPFTLGHRHLVETAARECERVYVFVLSEDASEFSATDRIAMVKLGTRDLPNVTVLPTGPYLISQATFPTYFLKDREQFADIHCLLDVQIFGKYFVPKFGITRRYVGTEPLSPMTAQYNRTLHAHLGDFGVQLYEIPRLCAGDVPISASTVRSLIGQGSLDAAAAMLPQTTQDYINELLQGGILCRTNKKTTF